MKGAPLPPLAFTVKLPVLPPEHSGLVKLLIEAVGLPLFNTV